MYNHLITYFNERKIDFCVLPGIGLQFKREDFNYNDFNQLLEANRIIFLDTTFIVTVN